MSRSTWAGSTSDDGSGADSPKATEITFISLRRPGREGGAGPGARYGPPPGPSGTRSRASASPSRSDCVFAVSSRSWT